MTLNYAFWQEQFFPQNFAYFSLIKNNIWVKIQFSEKCSAAISSMGKKNYRTCQLNSPLEKFWRVYVRVIFSSFSPYIDGQDSQKVKFCNFKWNEFALICTLRFCLNINSFNLALIYIFLMKMT